jgi:hypothetical protein
VKVVVHSYFVLNRRRLCAFVMSDDLLGLSPTVLVDRPSERGATRTDGQPLATGQPLQVLSLLAGAVICVLTMDDTPACASCMTYT